MPVNNEPLITIYIPCHNYGRYLKRAVESVLRQTYENWELFIFDENSTDNTQEVLNLFRGHQKIKILKTEGIGLINVANKAIEMASGEYLIRLDADDLFDDNILLVLSRRLMQNKDLAFVFPDYYLIDDYDEIISLERREKLYSVNNSLDVPAHGACTLFRLDVMKEIGGYSTEFKAQDGYYMWNKILSKYKCENINLPLFFYRRHDANLTNQSVRILTARRAIKLNEIKDKIKQAKPINIIIPCRENYDFRQDVWQIDLAGKTLLEHSLDNCINSDLWDNIIVACDNEAVTEVMKKYNDPRLKFFKREAKDTLRSCELSQSLEKICQVYDKDFKGITVISYVQSPFVKKETLEESVYTMLLLNSDSAFAVEEIRQEIFKRGPHGLTPINPKKFITSDYEVLYRDANTAFATKSLNFTIGSLLGSRVTNYYSIENESLFVDSEKSLNIAQSLLNTRK